MEDKSRQSLEKILSDCLLLDIDFSRWDEYVRLVVSPTEPEGSYPEFADVYNVDLVRVTQFRVTVPLGAFRKPEAPQHTRWAASCVEIREQADGFRLFIGGTGVAPDLELECADMRFELLDAKAVTALNANWAEPGQRLVRGHIEEIVALIRKPRRK